MRVTIHRGTHQIGGCVTEIEHERYKVFIDFGTPLPGSGGGKLFPIEGITKRTIHQSLSRRPYRKCVWGIQWATCFYRKNSISNLWKSRKTAFPYSRPWTSRSTSEHCKTYAIVPHIYTTRHARNRNYIGYTAYGRSLGNRCLYVLDTGRWDTAITYRGFPAPRFSWEGPTQRYQALCSKYWLCHHRRD